MRVLTGRKPGARLPGIGGTSDSGTITQTAASTQHDPGCGGVGGDTVGGDDADYDIGGLAEPEVLEQVVSHDRS